MSVECAGINERLLELQEKLEAAYERLEELEGMDEKESSAHSGGGVEGHGYEEDEEEERACGKKKKKIIREKEDEEEDDWEDNGHLNDEGISDREAEREDVEDYEDQYDEYEDEYDDEDDEYEEEEHDKEELGKRKNKKAISSMTHGQTWDDSLYNTLLMEKKRVSGSPNLPIAEVGHKWNGPEAKKRIFEWAGGKDFNPSKVKKAFFYFDEKDDKLKTSYKLPFADVIDDKLKVIPKALSAVKGALDGARGTGVSIPSSDKEKIMKKVNAYRNKIDNMNKTDDVLKIIMEFKKMVEELE